MKVNGKMNELLTKLKSLNQNKIISSNIKNLDVLLSPKFVQVHDCIIISDTPVKMSEAQFEKVIKMYTDKIGYEVSNTELRINDYIENEDISVTDVLSLTLLVIEAWANKLKVLDSEAKFCFVFSCDGNYVTLRFHKVRDKTLWISENLEGYDNPIGYMII